MRWEAKWGAQIEFLLEMEKQGHQSPALLDRPVRQAEFYWLFEAYDMLTRSRQIGMTEFYIPMTEYAAYLDIIQLDDADERIFLVSVLTHVDAVLLSERLQAAEKKQAA